MRYFEKIFRKLTNIGATLACFVLLGTMIITVANIAYRMSGHTIIGTYDLSELLIVVFVGFALAYAALTKAHVSVKIVIEFLSKRSQTFLECLTSMLGFIFWALVVWSSIELTVEKAQMGEKTDTVNISYIPFRCIFIFGLFLLSIILLIKFINSLRGEKSK
jgi:TRAP-type C4-dicarboxylate transport system permease small subunit